MPQHPTAWYLSMRKGPQAGNTYPLQGTALTIGRHADNQIVIDDPMISRHHARLIRQGDTFLLEDMGSANGTWVNKVRISGPVLLRDGDVIGLSQEVLLVFGNQPETDATILNRSAGRPVTPLTVQPPSIPVAMPPPPPAAVPAARGGHGWLAFGLGGVIAIIAVLGLAVVGLVAFLAVRKPTATSVLQAALPTLTPIPAATAYPADTPAPTDVPTQTPYPTYTPYPTPAPTATPYPTYTPYPTAVPTATPYPTYTPYPTAIPTATPYPTYTPYPTFTPRPAPPANPPTPTSLLPPSPAASAPYVIALGRNVTYEPWGRPTDAGGCRGPYDDESPVRRFTVETILTNNSNRFVTFDLPIFVSARGAPLPSCYWPYNPDDPKLEVVRPGESKNVTFGTHLETNDYVQAMVFELPDWTITLCLNGAGQQVPCQ